MVGFVKMKNFLLLIFSIACTAEARFIEGSRCVDAPGDATDRLSQHNTQCEGGSECCAEAAPAPTPAAPPPPLSTRRMAREELTTEYVPTPADYEVVGGGGGGDACAPIDSQLTAPKNGRKAWDMCVEYQQLVFPCTRDGSLLGEYSRKQLCHHNADQLVKNGTDAGKGEFPHMALLQYPDGGSDSFCGGTLISDRFVLTAGHCIANAENASVSHVRVGGLVLGEGVLRAVRRVLPHPEYRPPLKYHDIALLELDEPVPLNDSLVPACLHTGEAVRDADASATGWGRLDYRGPTSSVLQKVILNKFTNLECHATYQHYKRHLPRGVNRTTQTCYGSRGGTADTCEGDSGGPLHVKHESLGCMYVVVGVTSAGRRCGDDSQPALYSRVQHYAGWIESVVWP